MSQLGDHAAEDAKRDYYDELKRYIYQAFYRGGIRLTGAAAKAGWALGMVGAAAAGALVVSGCSAARSRGIKPLAAIKSALRRDGEEVPKDPWLAWSRPEGPDQGLAETVVERLANAGVVAQAVDGNVLLKASKCASGAAFVTLAEAGMVASLADTSGDRDRPRSDDDRVVEAACESELMAAKLANAMHARGFEAIADGEVVRYVTGPEGSVRSADQLDAIEALKAEITSHPEAFASTRLGKAETTLARERDAVRKMAENYVSAGLVDKETANEIVKFAEKDRPTESQLKYLESLVSKGEVPAEAADLARSGYVSKSQTTAYLNDLHRATNGRESYEIGNGTDMGLLSSFSALQSQSRDAYVGQNGQLHEAVDATTARAVPAVDPAGDVPTLADADRDGLVDAAEDLDGDSVPDDREERPKPLETLDEQVNQAKADALALSQIPREERERPAARDIQARL